MSKPDKLLFTPGPLTTSLTVKQAMLRDLGSRDDEFIALVRAVRQRLLAVAGVSQAQGYEAIPMQGSGTFAVESVLSSVLPPGGKLLMLVNGAYGERMVQMAGRLGIGVKAVICPENDTHDPGALRAELEGDPSITHVGVVHCETTTGVLNPVERFGEAVRGAGRRFIVDAMSSFGGIPLAMEGAGIDYLVSSANKCVEGVPGFAFVIARRSDLQGTEGWARNLSLDLLAQWQGLEKTGQFRYTPPTHALLAFDQALRELEAEGGAAGRYSRYEANHRALAEGMTELGFRAYVPAEKQAPVITAFHDPTDPSFRFDEFYRRLSDKGFVIYPGKLSRVDCFRVGNIGRLYPKDMRALVSAVGQVLMELGVPVPVS